MINRIGLIGDVHAQDAALAGVLAFLQTQNLDAILCTGDVADGAGEVNRCCRLLAEHGVLTVRGNHDRWLVQEQLRDLPNATPLSELNHDAFTFLRQLPSMREFSTPEGVLLLCHGLGENDMAMFTPDDYGYALVANDDLHKILQADRWRFVLNGHAHKRMMRRLDKTGKPASELSPSMVTFINAGLLTDIEGPVCTTIDFSDSQLSWFCIRDNPTLIDQLPLF